MKLKQFTITLVTLCIAISSELKAVQAASFTVIANGFDNPRGITYGPDGNLYVGEAGRGGSGACWPAPFTSFEPVCAGKTGAIVKITPDSLRQNLISNFQSSAPQPSQNQATGPEDLKFDSQGNAYFISGFGGNPANRDAELNALSANVQFPSEQTMIAPTLPPEQALNTPDLGKLYQIDLDTGNYTLITDLAKNELVSNPDGKDVISNPYAMAIKGDTAYIADGGANVVWNVKLDGSNVSAIPIPTRIVENPEFPPAAPESAVPSAGAGSSGEPLPTAGQPGLPPTTDEEAPDIVLPREQSANQVELQAVPTGIAVGPDGSVYVGEYSGFPYQERKARIWRIGDDGKPQVYADGFTQITDLRFDKDGNLLVLQFADQSQWKGEDEAALPGSLIKLTADGTRTTLIAAGEGLESATGIEVDPSGEIYIVNKGIGPGNGEVLRVDSIDGVASVPEPSSTLGLLVFGAVGSGAWLKHKRQQQGQ
ncbi:ScyD/ScyE family protein [Nostoc sp. CHAB 5715]|uniref:ScyD/ScyE family protein n=1 Tax=Nostoc sp. CHAB 5715 TaxID=2780400 RepID=UPI001E3AE158|nr:ScyD/ScyE family protein [Nostoc sp. CHAB 5715]MCC5625102.1 ScyD/ScyE family protein [Nostoc sp. CHAB 5715]